MSVTRSETGTQRALGHPGTLTLSEATAHGGSLGRNGTFVRATALARPATLDRAGPIGRAATPAQSESPQKKWSARRLVMFVIISCSVLWALIIAAAVQLWSVLS